MKKLLALLLAALMVLALCACGSSDAPAAAPAAPGNEAPAAAPAGEVTWADYQAYLIEKAGGNAPDPQMMADQVNALTGWDDIDLEAAPWNQFFTTLGLSTWEEFQQGIVKDSQVVGGPDASLEPSGEGSGEPAA